MNDKYFVDTNILIYSFDRANPSKRKIALDLISQALEISDQLNPEFD